MQIIPFNKLIVDNINISNVKFDENNGLYFSEVNYNLTDEIIIDLSDVGFETDSMKLLKVYEVGCNIQMEVEFLHTSNKFYDFIRNIDSHMIDSVTKNSKRHFGFDFKHNAFDSIFDRTIKLPDTIPALPKLILEIGTGGDCLIIDKYSRNGNASIKNLKCGQEVKIIMSIDKIYFDKCCSWLKYKVGRISIVNNFCPTLNCLLEETENYEFDSEDEIDYAATINEF